LIIPILHVAVKEKLSFMAFSSLFEQQPRTKSVFGIKHDGSGKSRTQELLMMTA
jgi:hypothetical protein